MFVDLFLDAKRVIAGGVNSPARSFSGVGGHGFNGDNCEFTNLISEQSPDISQGVTEGEGENLEQGAGVTQNIFEFIFTGI